MAVPQEADTGWSSARTLLRKKFGSQAFKNWIDPLTFGGVEAGCALLLAPSPFVRDWVMTHLREGVLTILQQCLSDVSDVDVRTQAGRWQEIALNDEGTNEPKAASLPAAHAHKTRDAFSTTSLEDEAVLASVQSASKLSTSVDGSLTFDNFVVGKPNEFAYAAARRVAEAVIHKTDASFNPLFLHGGVGLGKTHLMIAIVNAIREKAPGCSIVYLSAERFMYHFIRALRFKDMVSFKEQLRSVDILLVDDIQFIADKVSTQEEFFHTFNALVDQKRQVVLSADKSPSDLKGIEERVRSRLAWGLVADIHPTTYELRLGILAAKAEGKDVPQDVLVFLAQKITSNVRELEGALTRIIAYAQLVGRRMSVELARDVLSDLLRACDRLVTLNEIQQHVGNYYSVRPSRLASPERTKDIVRARQVFMFLSKELTSHSLPEIARVCGKKDHTTVLHGIRKMEKMMQTDLKLKEDIDLLRRMLQC